MVNKLIALDDGHGTDTAGKETPKISELNNKIIKENEFNREVIKFLDIELKRCGFKTLIVSPTDEDTPLEDRVDLANKNKCDAYISIHYNAYDGKFDDYDPEGLSVHVYPNNPNDRKLAECIHKYLIQGTEQIDRGIIEDDLYVLRNADCPAVLSENGFMDNKKEALRMLDENYQKEVAIEHAKGICDFFEVKYIEEVIKGDENAVIYKVQVGAFKNKDNAEKLLKQLKELGFEGIIETTLKTITKDDKTENNADLDIALDILIDKKIMTDKEYWLNNYNKIEYLDKFIIQMANCGLSPKTEIIQDEYTVNTALDVLLKCKIITGKQYWLTNYSKLEYLDKLIINMAKYLQPIRRQPKVDANQITYTETSNGTRQIFLPPEKLKIDTYTNLKAANSFTKYKYAVNGTFYLMEVPSYSTSILIVDGKILRWGSNYCEDFKPQDCFIIYKDGTLEMKRMLNVSELGNKLYSVKHAIGGIGLVDKDNPNFKYSLKDCGFPENIGRKCNKTILGYIKETNKLVLTTRPNIYNSSEKEYDLIDLARDCGYDKALIIDGSFSSITIANGAYKLKSGDNRGLYSVLYAE